MVDMAKDTTNATRIPVHLLDLNIGSTSSQHRFRGLHPHALVIYRWYCESPYYKLE